MSRLSKLAIIFSFVVNLVLVIVVVLLLAFIFQIKRDVLDPLVGGLHENFIGLDEAIIEYPIKVSDAIPVKFDVAVDDTMLIDFMLPLNQTTDVVLQAPVPLQANASFNLPGGGGTINGTVSLNLPPGLVLPVSLNMDVPVNQIIPVNLNVPVDEMVPVNLIVDARIPLNQTQLHTPFFRLRMLLEPYAALLQNLPDSWGDFIGWVGGGGLSTDLMATPAHWPPGQDIPYPTPLITFPTAQPPVEAAAPTEAAAPQAAEDDRGILPTPTP
jgi:hypothetical protein